MFLAFKYYFAHVHKYAVLKQYETNEKRLPESYDDKLDASEDHKETDLQALKLKILKSSLSYVPEYGWNEKALAFGILNSVYIYIVDSYSFVSYGLFVIINIILL